MLISTPAQTIATEFLDQWERAHSVKRPDYNRLAAKYAAYTGSVCMGDVEAVRHALRAGWKARGWPDPKPAPAGRMSAEPTIEDAIITLWLCALRSARIEQVRLIAERDEEIARKLRR
jgi:hypothetical protein